MQHETFHYRSLSDVRGAITATDAWLPLSEDFSGLFTPVAIERRTAANRFVIQPMEGCDAEPDGSPSPLCTRRYQRFAHGGAAVIWFESIAVVPEGRSTARELMISRENLDDYKRLLDGVRTACLKENGHAPIILPQLTHSGRFCNPTSRKKEPMIAAHNPVLEQEPLPESCVVTDDYLLRLQDRFAETAALCEQAGFDGVDLKACHGYLAAELMASDTREGRYGGSFENRTRFLTEIAEAVCAATAPDFLLGLRLNATDVLPWPYGIGDARDGAENFDESIALARLMRERYGLHLFNVSCGIGYYNPHVLRPYDHGAYVPDEHPLTGLSRHNRATAAIKAALPDDCVVIGSAFSYLRQFSPYSAAGMLAGGYMDMAGYGRMAFAYPDFVRELKENGALDPRKCCVTCSQCTIRLRAGLTAGCVVRDKEAYPVR